jgi:hypothetical protein
MKVQWTFMKGERRATEGPAGAGKADEAAPRRASLWSLIAAQWMSVPATPLRRALSPWPLSRHAGEGGPQAPPAVGEGRGHSPRGRPVWNSRWPLRLFLEA